MRRIHVVISGCKSLSRFGNLPIHPARRSETEIRISRVDSFCPGWSLGFRSSRRCVEARWQNSCTGNEEFAVRSFRTVNRTFFQRRGGGQCVVRKYGKPRLRLWFTTVLFGRESVSLHTHAINPRLDVINCCFFKKKILIHN